MALSLEPCRLHAQLQLSHLFVVGVLQTDYFWLWLGILVLIGYTVVFNGECISLEGQDSLSAVKQLYWLRRRCGSVLDWHQILTYNVTTVLLLHCRHHGVGVHLSQL